jgi:alcohol dehydrogenase class IV
MAANIKALRRRAPESEALKRYREIAGLLTGDKKSAVIPEQATSAALRLIRQLGIVPLSEYGILPSDWPDLAELAERSSSMKANPITLTRDEIIQIFEAESSAIL